MPEFIIKAGDAVQLLKELDSNSVDYIVTDPPYCNGGMTRSAKWAPTSQKIQQNGTKDLKPDFFGDARDQRSYMLWLKMWMDECWRICKDGAVICVFIDWRNITCVIDMMQVANFAYRGIFSWVKPNGRPVKNAFKSDVEFVVWGVKGQVKPLETGDVYSPGHFILPAVPTAKRIHGTEKPVEVLEALMCFCPDNGTVVDPFCGSGATGVACAKKGLNFVGFELSEQYAKLATERLEKCYAD